MHLYISMQTLLIIMHRMNQFISRPYCYISTQQNYRHPDPSEESRVRMMRLYVVTRESPDIDVYDIDTLAHRRKIRVKGLVNGYDIVAHANVLYVSEFLAKLIHRIQLSDETSSHWSVNSIWLKMSINKNGNVVVSCSLPNNKIIEYTPTGRCVREIQVDAIDRNIDGFQHAIQLDDDRVRHLSGNNNTFSCLYDRQQWQDGEKLRRRKRVRDRTDGFSTLFSNGSEWYHSCCWVLQQPHNTIEYIAWIHQRIHSWICWSEETVEIAFTRGNETSLSCRGG